MIKIKRGLNLPLSGAPKQAISRSPAVRSVAIVGADYPGLQPTMQVAEGDSVRCGQILFSDKKNAHVVFTAPVSGRVRAVNRGARRVFLSLVIDIDPTITDAESFTAHSVDALSSLSAEAVTEQLRVSGLWTALRTRPFSKVPVPGTTP